LGTLLLGRHAALNEADGHDRHNENHKHRNVDNAHELTLRRDPIRRRVRAPLFAWE
jgi:hypothetical protein